MMETQGDPTLPPDDAFCIGCGYSLRGLHSPRCPECGREFDPKDSATMSLGAPLRAWQRAVLRPTSWPVMLLAVLGTVLIVCLSGWPGIVPEPTKVMWQEFRTYHTYGLIRLSKADWVFWCGLGSWAMLLLLWLSKICLRKSLGKPAHKSNPGRMSIMRRNRVVLAMAIVTIFWLFFGWRERIARRWIPMDRATANSYSSLRLVDLSQEQSVDVLSHSLANEWSSDDRIYVLGMLLRYCGRSSLPGICHAAHDEKDEQVLAWELRAIGLFRDQTTEVLLLAKLDDPRPGVRAAAIDALGILRRPTYSIFSSSDFTSPAEVLLDTTPAIDLADVTGPPRDPIHPYSFGSRELMDEPIVALGRPIRDRFERMMLEGTSAEEREAAARALVEWPPEHCRLRLAEWGVWIENKGHLGLSKEIADEIPLFVHHTGNDLKELDSYFRSEFIVTKPVIHVTSDVPMALDIGVAIQHGRPWFAYPYPDDFEIEETGAQQSDVPLVEAFHGSLGPPGSPPDLSPPVPGVLPEVREGYPWLIPHHTAPGRAGYGIGCRWQSLVVSPQQLPWMTLPGVSNNPRFQWWKQLRNVPSDWVCNRGETERFLYYDGPTRSRAPMGVKLDAARNRLLLFEPGIPQYAARDSEGGALADPAPLIAGSVPAKLPAREGLYVEVHGAQIAAQHFDIEHDSTQPLPANLPLQGDAVTARFRKMIVDYGLTDAEAEGLMQTWSPWLFHAEGKRFILRMSPADYDRQCPMRVRPTLTEIVRLGLVLTEFGPDLPPASHTTKSK
jgi:hypothetical protein